MQAITEEVDQKLRELAIRNDVVKEVLVLLRYAYSMGHQAAWKQIDDQVKAAMKVRALDGTSYDQ